MNYQQREVPLDYADLLDAVHGGVFPAERHWLDFKRELYARPAANGTPVKAKPKKEVHQELARDLASLAVRGGYLVFGVEEDKASHTFTVVDMPLPAHLDQTVDQVARDFVDPPLLVAPTLLTNPGNPGRGMMVIEVAESPDAPHMVGRIYYGRSETGKVKLADDEVERLILRRGRVGQRLEAAMADTLAADPESGTEAAHFYLTAVPTQGWPGMLLDYTRDPAAHRHFMTTANGWHNAIARADTGQRSDGAAQIAFGSLIDTRRGQRPRGAWFYNYPQSPPDRRLGMPRRALALDDDGTVRFTDMAAGSLLDGRHPAVAERMQVGYPGGTLHSGSVIYDANMWWETLDLVRLIGWIAESHSYSGNWLVGAELTRMRGRRSSAWGTSECDTDQLAATSRATTRQLLEQPREVASALLRPLFRDIGSEKALEQLDTLRGSAMTTTAETSDVGVPAGDSIGRCKRAGCGRPLPPSDQAGHGSSAARTAVSGTTTRSAARQPSRHRLRLAERRPPSPGWRRCCPRRPGWPLPHRPTSPRPNPGGSQRRWPRPRQAADEPRQKRRRGRAGRRSS